MQSHPRVAASCLSIAGLDQETYRDSLAALVLVNQHLVDIERPALSFDVSSRPARCDVEKAIDPLGEIGTTREGRYQPHFSPSTYGGGLTKWLKSLVEVLAAARLTLTDSLLRFGRSDKRKTSPAFSPQY